VFQRTAGWVEIAFFFVNGNGGWARALI
jgi:hypothetical protein